jgi:hypothetical protein
MTPVRAMTTFFPFVDCQKFTTRYGYKFTEVALIAMFHHY